MAEPTGTAVMDVRPVLDAIACGVVIEDGVGAILFANRAAQRMLGFGLSELREMSDADPAWQFQHEDGATMAPEVSPAGMARTTGKPQYGVLAMIFNGGARHIVDVTAMPIEGAGHRVKEVVLTFIDLTEQRAAEAALRRSTEHFRTLIEHMPVGAVLVDPDGRMLFCNAVAGEIYGDELARYQGRSLVDGSWWMIREDGSIIPREDTATGRALIEGKPVRNVVGGILNSARADPVWVEMNAVPRIDEAGRLINVVVTSVDITARRRSEATNALYAELMRQLPSGFAAFRAEDVTDLHSLRLIAANPAADRYAGRPLNTMIGSKIDQCFPGAVDAYTAQTHGGVLRTRQPVNIGDFAYAGLAERPSFYSLLVFPLPNDSVGILAEDITDRKHAAEYAEHLSAIVESSSDGIIGLSVDGIIKTWNRGAEQVFGYSTSEVVGQRPTRMIPLGRQNEFPDVLRRVRTGERVAQFETTRIRKDGVEIHVAFTISPIKDEQGRTIGASAIARDMTARKKADDRIRSQVDQLSALRAIDVSITGNYDIRVSLNVVLEQVIACLGVDGAAVLLLNPATQMLTHAAGQGFRGKEITKTRIRLGEDLPGAVALDRKRIGMPVLPVSRFVRAKLLQEESFVSYFAAPLRNKGQVLGVLEVFTRTRLDPDEEWYEFLDTLAGQTAIALSDAAQFDDLRRRNIDLQSAYDATLEGWSRALDLRDRETEGHSRRVTEMTVQLARQFELREDEMIQVRRGALLHDIGKLGVPDGILLKPGPLTEEEWAVMRRHPTFAYDLLQPIKFLRPAIDIPYCHHEKWDGTGYPRGLRDTQIPLAARIFAVVDVWDALSSNRPYRDGWPEARVREHIAAGAGAHFDSEVVTAFLAMEWPARVDPNAGA